MDPLSIGVSAAASHILGLIDWHRLTERLAGDSIRAGATGILHRVRSNDREKAIEHAISLFVNEFYAELEDKTPLSAALPGYRDQIKRLVEYAAPEIVSWLQPETKEVDLGPVERICEGLKLDPLPEDFSWELVAHNYARGIRRYVKSNPEMRAALAVALQEQTSEALERLAGPAPNFDLQGYRAYLGQKCTALQLAVMHTSTYRYDRQITLWSVFVPQTARESAPSREMPRELIRRLKEEGQIAGASDERQTSEIRERYQNSPVLPVLEILNRERLVVILGDPGSGKTSLLKYLVLRWAADPTHPLPLWIDLKEYVKERQGVLKYVESGCGVYKLDAREIDKRLRAGQAALYLDGLDEIFDGPTRGSVVEEVAAFTAQFPAATAVVTSRIVGYESERLRNAGFVHATLEDFDINQILDFLHRWYEVAEIDKKERLRLLGQLERAIGDSTSIRELAGNPLLVTMMAILNRTQDLPRDRVELYREASRVLLHEWDASRSLPVDTFARQEKEALLRELAGTMQHVDGGLAGNLIERGQLMVVFFKFLSDLGVADSYAKTQSLVQQLTERNFILCYAGADRFSFVHRTFLEYYCAAWFIYSFQVKQTLSMAELKEAVFERHWRDEKWHEVLRLIAGLLGETKAEELILLLIEQDGSQDKQANLILAAGCLSEIRNRRVISGTDDLLRRRFVDQAIRRYRLDYRDWSESVRVAQRAVGTMAQVWRDEKTRIWLQRAAESSSNVVVRDAAVHELAKGWQDEPETLHWIRDLIQLNTKSDVRAAAIQELALRWKYDSRTLSTLRELVRSDSHWEVLRVAVQELARLGTDDSEVLSLLKALVDSGLPEPVKREAVQGVSRGWPLEPGTSLWLKTVANSGGNWAVCETAVHELARGWKHDPETLTWLKGEAESNAGWSVGRAAVQEVAQRWQDKPETVTWLKKCAINNPAWYVRSEAIEQLARGWKNEADSLPFVKDRAISDYDRYAVSAALRAVATHWKENPETKPWLQACALSKSNWGMRRTAVWELADGWADDPEVLQLVKNRARSDGIGAVRREAIVALAFKWPNDPESFGLLKESARGDAAEGARRSAIQGLVGRWSGDPSTLPLLKECASLDPKPKVRAAAIRAVGSHWKSDAGTLPWLKERAVSDEAGTVRLSIFKLLMRFWKKSPDVRPFIEERVASDADEALRREMSNALA